MSMINYQKKGSIGIVELDDPAALNALTPEGLTDLRNALAACQDDEGVRVIILTGAGDKAFCAGANLKKTFPPTHSFAKGALSSKEVDAENGGYTRLMDLSDLHIWKPMIAAINGYCLGGGFEMAMMGDFIVASESASFGLPEGKHSLIPGAGGTQNLPRLIGAPLAKELMWTGRRISGSEAKEYRIVNHVVETGKALTKVRAIVEEMKGVGPLSQMMTKQSIDRGVDMSLQQGFMQEADLAYMLSWSDDRAEGLKAFSERRKPDFKGQ